MSLKQVREPFSEPITGIFRNKPLIYFKNARVIFKWL